MSVRFSFNSYVVSPYFVAPTLKEEAQEQVWAIVQKLPMEEQLEWLKTDAGQEHFYRTARANMARTNEIAAEQRRAQMDRLRADAARLREKKLQQEAEAEKTKKFTGKDQKNFTLLEHNKGRTKAVNGFDKASEVDNWIKNEQGLFKEEGEGLSKYSVLCHLFRVSFDINLDGTLTYTVFATRDFDKLGLAEVLQGLGGSIDDRTLKSKFGERVRKANPRTFDIVDRWGKAVGNVERVKTPGRDYPFGFSSETVDLPPDVSMKYQIEIDGETHEREKRGAKFKKKTKTYYTLNQPRFLSRRRRFASLTEALDAAVNPNRFKLPDDIAEAPPIPPSTRFSFHKSIIGLLVQIAKTRGNIDDTEQSSD